MSLAVCIRLDRDAESSVRRIWQEVERLDVVKPLFGGPLVPHITLGCFQPEGDCIPAVKRIGEAHQEFALEFSGVAEDHIPETDKYTIYLRPVFSPLLREIHTHVHEALGAQGVLSVRAQYNPGQWIPHCTLAWGKGKREFEKVCRRIAQIPHPDKCTASSLWVFDLEDLVEVDTIELD